MNIRIKLTIQFTLIIAGILILFSAGIYYFSATYRENDFYSRLKDRANTTAKLFLVVDEVDSTLLKIIDKNTFALYQEHIFIYNEKNVIIYSNPDTLSDDESIIPREEIKKFKYYKFSYGEREAVGILYKVKSKDYITIASAYDKYGIAKLNNLKIVLLAVFFFSMLITIFAGLFYSGRALAPISAVIKQVNKISISDLNLRVDEGNKTDEIGKLAITFNLMLSRLENAFILQREFVSNASHELRTPFSVMLAEIDYTLMNERDNERYRQVLLNLFNEIKDLNLLSNSLLELARMSFENQNFDLKPIRIDELLLVLRSDILKINTDFSILINFKKLPDDEFYLYTQGNEQLLRIAFKNLIENACKFSSSKQVNITFLANQDEIRLDFEDQGIGIPPEDLAKIFEPFYRGKNTHYIPGFGMGLALTKKIIILHKGTVNVSSELNTGSIFSIILPNHKKEISF